jgi:[ribosomal protein S5]-alanine N-acetyltransferase
MCILESKRLILRPPRHSDIQGMTAWLSDFDVARMTSRVPHPYSEGDAEAFFALKVEHRFAIQRKSDGVFLGMAGLHAEDDYEFGYWLGKPFWGLGLATEAAHRLVTYAFEALGLETVHAGWFHDNPASGHVLVKLGACHNGSAMRDCRARGMAVLCHDMLLTRADFLRKQAA